MYINQNIDYYNFLYGVHPKVLGNRFKPRSDHYNSDLISLCIPTLLALVKTIDALTLERFGMEIIMCIETYGYKF